MARPTLRAIPIAILVLLVVPPVFARQELSPRRVDQAARLVASGTRALNNGNVRKAVEQFDRALAIVPEFPDAHMALGHVAIAEKRFADALTSYERARGGYEAMGDALFRLRLERYHEAGDQVRRLQTRRNEVQERLLLNRDPSGALEIQLQRVDQDIARLEAIEPPTEEDSDQVPSEVDFYVGNALMNLERDVSRTRAARLDGR